MDARRHMSKHTQVPRWCSDITACNLIVSVLAWEIPYRNILYLSAWLEFGFGDLFLKGHSMRSYYSFSNRSIPRLLNEHKQKRITSSIRSKRDSPRGYFFTWLAHKNLYRGDYAAVICIPYFSDRGGPFGRPLVSQAHPRFFILFLFVLRCVCGLSERSPISIPDLWRTP